MSFIVTQSFTFLRDIISLCRSKFPSCIMFLRKGSAATRERNKTHPWSPATYSLLKAVVDKEENPWTLPILSQSMKAMWCWRDERREPGSEVPECRSCQELDMKEDSKQPWHSRPALHMERQQDTSTGFRASRHLERRIATKHLNLHHSFTRLALHQH